MLKSLRLENVGPAEHLEWDFAPRLNVITGDNGLGKSFILEICWWALTQNWVSHFARPTSENPAKISFSIGGDGKVGPGEGLFNRRLQDWTSPGRPTHLGLVLFAQVDGSFAVWDPARNSLSTRNERAHGKGDNRPPAFMFTPSDLWDGLEWQNGVLCNGLIRDWALWQTQNGKTFEQLQAVLARLSPSNDEEITPGELTRVSLDDVRDIPTLRMPYGQEVPVSLASAGMKRILGLAYLLVWSWHEHQQASKLLGEPVTQQVVFLIDEAESHLHPKWQRTIMGALLDVMTALSGTDEVSLQVLATTHSPLLLASLEPRFNPEIDALWTLELKDKAVVGERQEWRIHGDANRWLTSPIFDFDQPGSAEAEKAIERAKLALRERQTTDLESITAELQRVLSETDPFWVRWLWHLENLSRSR